MRPEPIFEIEITTLTHGGRGLGHHDGKAVFVPGTLPGDRVACRVVKSKSRYAEAELLNLVTPSAQRRESPCPYFGSCGGCQWQHIPYTDQIDWKAKIFSELLLRAAVAPAERILPIVASANEWSYRNRVQFKCSMDANGLQLGFNRRGSHRVIDVECCRLVVPQIQAMLTLLRRELPGAPRPRAVSQVEVACGDRGELRVVLHLQPKAVSAMRPWLLALASEHGFAACLQAGAKSTLEVVYGEAWLTVHVDTPELELRYGPGGFAQVNSTQNRALIKTMLARLELLGSERVLDLFCGMGNFSLPLALRVASVCGVEGYAPAIADARANAVANNLTNLDFHAEDAAGFVLGRGADEFDLVVLDPPRSGDYQVAKAMAKLRPDRVLYISCDPATLVRDLKIIVGSGYEVVSTQAFDLFPQTWHIESMTLLHRVF